MSRLIYSSLFTSNATHAKNTSTHCFYVSLRFDLLVLASLAFVALRNCLRTFLIASV